MITFVRRVRMRNGHFDEALRLLRQRVDYLWDQHGLKLELKIRFGGPVGEVALVSHHRDAAELEHLRQKLMFDAGSNQLLRALSEVTLAGETRDEIWMD
ncbi:hypothetical protein [Castellaniella defragrans]|jgi:hypothetical protein|uniref:ABM domain-containing protein n=2 Tax=Castellaniella defragrans TaxID=75697 RepID=W8X0F5_CASD6|nr:hypothetical protein [Castellaniella defragrans]KAB0622249.1 hypothetical protein F7Q88_04080 [Castellaniella defragrans]MBB6084223.1 hypothetical protein [Castellaniella defragrans]CDM22717.1 hypothetical protein BN940_01201 [Castellaniella defragrans 65Phen]